MGFAASDVAESPIMNAVHKFHKGRTVADLESHIQTEFVLRPFANFDDFECARDVNSYRLLKINMLPCSDDCLQVMGMVVGWSSYDDRVHFLGSCNPLVGIRSFKKLCSVQRCITFPLLQVVKMLARDVQLVLEHVSQCDHAGAPRIDKVGRILSSSTTATQQTYTDGGIGSSAAHVHDVLCDRGTVGERNFHDGFANRQALRKLFIRNQLDLRQLPHDFGFLHARVVVSGAK